MELSDSEKKLVVWLEREIDTPKVTGLRGKLVAVDTPRILRADLEDYCGELQLVAGNVISRFISLGLLAESEIRGPYFDIKASLREVATPIIAAKLASLDKVALAVGYLYANPDSTDQQVADAIGCHRSTLFKPSMAKYREAKAFLKSGRERYRRNV